MGDVRRFINTISLSSKGMKSPPIFKQAGGRARWEELRREIQVPSFANLLINSQTSTRRDEEGRAMGH